MTARLNIRLRTVLLAGCAFIGIGCAALSAPAQAQDAPKTYAIAGQDLGAALRAFALISGRDVVFDPALVKGKTTHGAEGQLGDEAALRRLLAGSGLDFDRTATGGFVVRAARSSDPAASQGQAVEQLIVTAQKEGEQRLLDTPSPMSVMKPESLSETSQVQLRDYFLSVPGLSVTPDIEAQQEIGIRGISSSSL